MSFDKLIGDASNYIKKEIAGLSPANATISKLSGSGKLPWNNHTDTFFGPLEIEGSRWNKLYPYRLVVIDANKGNSIVGGDSKSTQVSNTASTSAKANGGISYVLTQEVVSGNWVYNFPITPQQYSVTDQYAISTNATMRGVVEEHNGVKFKMISMSGTTGIWPLKPSNASVLKNNNSIIGGLLSNTFENLGNVLGQVSKVKKAFTGEKGKGTAKTPFDSTGDEATGYYQALLLGQFLERYAQAKKRPENKGWRLVLDVPKENQSFIVTPQQFSLQKSQQKPNEYMWSMQLKAWKRINLKDTFDPSPSAPLNLGTPNILSRLNNTIRETRRTIGASINLVKAVRSDFQKPLNALRQTALALKDLGGLAYTVIDLPRNVINDYKSSIKDSLFIARNSYKRDSEVRATSGGSSVSGVSASAIKAGTLETQAGNAINLLVASVGINEGLSGSAISNGALGTNSAQQQELDPLNSVFLNPEENFNLFDGIDINSLVLTPEQQNVVDNEILNASLITQDDLNGYKQDILNLALDISNNFGAGSSTYSDIYSRPDPRERTTDMTVEEVEILDALYEAIQVYDILTSTKLFDDSKSENPLEYVGGLAAQGNIPFEESTSKFLVPVPFGLTIEEISARYLGNPDRWIEIATINYLRSPYIDEDGFTYSLLSNATGRQFNVNDQEKRLYIGQKIVLFSNTVPQLIRNITNVEKINDTNYLVTVDGLANLDNLQISQSAMIRGYLPGTVNSQDQLYIPSNLPVDNDDRIKTPPAFDNDRLTKISKIDWLLTDDGDIAINGLGEFRLANGLNNLVQALKIKIRTKKDSLLRHPDFGLGIQPGISIADIERGDLAKDLVRLVTSDPRFSGVERLTIEIIGPTLRIDMAITIANNSGVIPISFSV